MIRKLGAIACLSATVLFNSAAYSKSETAGKQKAPSPRCTLVYGGDQDTVGSMFQYLQDREVGANGTPKDVVDAYPNSFENVGDLVHQKCDVSR